MVVSSPAEAKTANDFFDTASIWLTYCLVFSLPLMFFNPMLAQYHRLQLSELFSVSAFFVMLIQLIRGRIKLPPLGASFCSVLLFLLICFFSAIHGLNPRHSFIELIKLIYLLSISCLIYINGINYQLRDKLWDCLSYSFLVVLSGAALGVILLYMGVSTSLVQSSRIISIALGVSSWLEFIPRVSSFLQPTANMLGVYLAALSLPVLIVLSRKKFFQKQSWVLIIVMALVILFGALTMSRAFVGVLLAMVLGCLSFQWKLPARKTVGVLLLIGAMAGWLILLFYTVLYPVKFKLAYTNDPSFKKEIVVLKENDRRPNPVYFTRKGVGLEKINIEFNYAINHYAWLKYASWAYFKEHRWLGAGLGNYPLVIRELAVNKVVPGEMANFVSAQSQYATLLAETGLAGLLGFFLMSAAVLANLNQQYKSFKDPLSLAVMWVVLILFWLAIDIDILSFRWLWGFVAISLIRPAVLASD